MKKIFFCLLVFNITFSIISFKSNVTEQEKLLLLKNYKINEENLNKYFKEYNADVVTNSKIGCRYYCYVTAMLEAVTAVYYQGTSKSITGQEISLKESDIINLEKLKYYKKYNIIYHCY